MTPAGGASLDPANDEAQEVELGNVRLIHADGNGYSDRPFHEVLQPTCTSRLARVQQLFHRWRRSPVAFWATIGGLVTLVLLILLVEQWATKPAPAPLARSCLAPGSYVGDTTAPEGSIRSRSIEAMYDWRGRPRLVSAASGMVAADHSRCSDIGRGVLQDGGNAVDAAVATALCQGVMNPMASGLGGGHFMLIRLPNGTAEVIDAREVAPAAANETMFKGRPELSLVGGLAVGVPLELKGLHLAHQRHGSLPWARLVEPSIDAAERGFQAHPYLVAMLEGQNLTAWQKDYPLLRDTFLILETKGWRPPKINETCCARPSLAALLRDVAALGPDVLYTGKYAAGLVAEVAARGGVLTAADLAAAQPVVRQPLRASAMGVDLITAPPPSSGATVLTALMVLAGYNLPLAGAGPLGVHRLVESMKHAFALRMSLGDPGPGGNQSYANVAPVLKDMLSQPFADSLRAAINDSGVLNATAYGGRWGLRVAPPPEDHGTSHISVVDSGRMAVSMTTTVNSGFGAKLFSKSTGLVLNNQMDDFSTPGQPNLYGLQPSPANYIRPGKRPLSSMSPLIVEQAGQLRLVLGGSGGPRIISAVLQALVRVLAYGEDLFSAVANPRLHHQLVPGQLFAEQWEGSGVAFAYSEKTLQALQRRGHNVSRTDWSGVTQAISVSLEDGTLTGVSDPRKDGAPAGF